MKKYLVKFVDGNGIKSSKQMYASEEKEIYDLLSEQKLVPVEVKPVAKSVIDLLSGDKLSTKLVESFITNLASLLNSGINLDRSLTLLSRSAENANLKSLIHIIQNDIRSGCTLADSLKKHPENFSDLVINLVNIGESTGTLDSVLSDLSQQLKFQEKINSQIKQAAIYPLVIVFVCVLSVLFILVSVVPQLSEMLEQVDDIPVYTQFLMAMSDFVRSTTGWISIAVVCLGGLYLFTSQNYNIKNFRITIKAWFVKLPIINGMQLLSLQLRFASAMMVTLRSGLSLTNALELSAGTLNDINTQKKMKDIKSKVQGGETLASSVEKSAMFSAMEVGFIEVGEETGDLSKAFTEIQERKSFEFDTKLSSLLKLLEPLLILLMGLIVGSIVIIMMLSIMSAQDVGL